jgi:hypothetical protein
MNKFSPLDMSSYYNIDRNNTLVNGQAPWNPLLTPLFTQLPGGGQTFWGIPFTLGPQEGGNSWLFLGRDTQATTLPVTGKASYIVFVHFADTSRDPQSGEYPDSPGSHVFQPGELLAEYSLIFSDGSEHLQPIRRRFEINDVASQWGSLAFIARPHPMHQPIDIRGPFPRDQWGDYQCAVADGNYRELMRYSLYALPNPDPEKPLAALRLRSTGPGSLAIAAITLYHGQEHPLRHRRLETMKISLPAEEAAPLERIETGLDMGIIASKEAHSFNGASWLEEFPQGWGEEPQPSLPVSQFTAEITAHPEATLKVSGHSLELTDAYTQGRAVSSDGKLRVEVVNPHKTWVRVTVEDASTGLPTPARVHLRSADGRYLPPYGHRHQVNANWFEDYGGDLKLGDTQYAYVDGRFLVELPVGEVYVELCKGFEYRPVRQKLTIQPGQQELKLRLERPINLRQQGWVTADTHVHFLSPQTAFLEAQGEGVNLVNLLASQWGDLFTNVADISGEASGVSRNDTIVWVGTENRQHLLGHMSLLGVKGEPVFPMCASGPGESYLGDPTWSSLGEWADRCRAQEGVVILTHFPHPLGELVADIVLGKIDGAELRDFFTPTINTYSVNEWYRFLNLGYRLAAVGGTDKMFAGMPVGGVRTYAHLGDQEFSFANWGKAVRAGRTFTSSGPLLSLQVEGKTIGDEIKLPEGGGTLEVVASAVSMQPFHELQLVVNGEVVASETAGQGANPGPGSTRGSNYGAEALRLQTHLRLDRTSWIAARCSGKLKLWQGWPVYTAAHTSPVYVKVGENELFNPSDATYMLTILEGGLAWLDTLSIPADAERQRRVRGIFTAAQEHLSGRLHSHT